MTEIDCDRIAFTVPPVAVGNTYTIIIYVQGGKLKGSEISEKSSEKEVKSVL